MEPNVEMGVVKNPPRSPNGTSNPVKEYLELAMRGEFDAFQDEMGKHPLGITAGVDVYEDRSALHMAALHGRIEVVKLILSAPEVSSQIVNARDRFGYTPLHLAVRAEHEDVVRILAKSPQTRILAACGSSGRTIQKDEQGQDCDGFTPLHLAAMSGNIAIVKLFLQEFACQELTVNIHVTNWQGTTALDIAKRRRDLKLMDILESWDVTWLQLERQKSANSVNAILVGAALVATVTFGCLLQPPLGIPNPQTPTNSTTGAGAPEASALVATVTFGCLLQPLLGIPNLQTSTNSFVDFEDIYNRVQVGWFLVCTAFSFSFAIVSLVIGTTAVIPSTGSSLKREVQQLRSSALRASISLFVALFFLLWASQIGGLVLSANIVGGGIVKILVSIVWFSLPIIVLAFVLRHIVLPKVKVKVNNCALGVFLVVAVGLNIGIYFGLAYVVYLDVFRSDV